MTKGQNTGASATKSGNLSVEAASKPSPTGAEPVRRQWTCICISGGADHVDDLAAMIAARFAEGVEITDECIRLYLPREEGVGQTWEAELRQVFDEFRTFYGESLALQFSTQLVEEEGWADRWKEHFKPLRVGSRFIVCPTWEEPHASTGDVVIRIDPGQAFGTGHHETTRLCLEWLDAYDAHWSRQRRVTTSAGPRPALLDVGTGSGILAIGAALLGWPEVVAIDVDPEALQVAAENTALNGLETRIRLISGGVDQVPGRYDVVMANIQALPLINLAAALAERLAPSGHLVLSGILQEQRDMVVAAYQAQRLRLSAERTAGEWCLLEFALDMVRS